MGRRIGAREGYDRPAPPGPAAPDRAGSRGTLRRLPDLLGHPWRFALRHPGRVAVRLRSAHRSALADRWLKGLHGVEIGGSAHHDFGLETVNVDRSTGLDTVYKREELERCGRAMHGDRTFDRDRPVTPVDELLDRHAQGFRSDEDRHWTVWTCDSFVELCERLAIPVLETQDPDDKTGNGFAAVLDAMSAGADRGPN